MKVSDIMQKSVVTVSEDTPLKEVGRLIFSLGISGIPVVKGKYLIGIVTEQDILSKMYPTLQDVAEDYVHARDFNEIEKNIEILLGSPVKEVMNTKVTTVSADTPLMKAQSIMLLNEFSRLPIVNSKHELQGIISQGDIFRQILKDEIPKLEQERYAGFVANYYDRMVNWKKRFDYEFPTLFKLFRKEKVSSILDLGTWTGEYTIGLAKRGGYSVFGIDHNPVMIELCDMKRDKMSHDLQKKVEFKLSDFTNLPSDTTKKFDAAISMGNSLPYIPNSLNQLVKGTSALLREKNAVIVFQILNFEKILHTKNRLLSFIIQKSNHELEKEHLFVEFFDKKKDGWLTHHVIVFDSDGKNWIFKGITSIPIRYIRMEDVDRALTKNGFKHIVYAGNMGEYQGDYGKLSFTSPFKPLESDWLNVVAKR